MYTDTFRNIDRFGDVNYDKRTTEYDDCEGVGEVIDKIRKGMDKGTKNEGDWQSNSIVEQVDCLPVYTWDGKFYTSEEKAKAGLTTDEVMSPSDSGALTSDDDKKEPGQHVRKKGKFRMSSKYSNEWAEKIALNSDGIGWLSRSDRYTRKDNWLQMETVSGAVELIKGVVTKGHYTKKRYVKKFKVFVSRNGESWKQVKNSSKQEEFTGNNDSNHNKETKNYFNETVEAKYIRVYPTDYKTYPCLRLGYIKDLSGVVNCIGGDGMQQDNNPWFRFKFDEAKTRLKGVYSSGTSNSTKKCPSNGSIMVAEKTPDSISINTEFNENNIKLVVDNDIDGLKAVMKNKTLDDCGVDPISKGWFSSSTFASEKKWGPCRKPNGEGLPSEEIPWHKDDTGFMYMYRHWDNSNNNGYNMWNDGKYKDYKTNGHSGDPSGNTYPVPDATFTMGDYDSVNIIRQPCRRGVKGKKPVIGDTIWESTTPYVDGMAVTSGASGYMGRIRNLSGGKEGWIDQGTKYTWANKFNDTLKTHITSDTVLNDYEVEEKVGTNANNAESDTWSNKWMGTGGIDGPFSGDRGWHSTQPGTTWTTSTTDNKRTARYKDTNLFIPVGIRIQPLDHSTAWDDYAPTVVRFRLYHKGATKPKWCPNIVLGPFKKDEVKTILIEPDTREDFIVRGKADCDHFYVYTRHGFKSSHVAFRINFLVGQIGTGKKSIEKSWTSTSPHRPVDCSTGEDGVMRSEVEYGSWNSYNNCTNCGTHDINNTYGHWRTREKRFYQDYKVISPSYGGKNNCTKPATAAKRDFDESMPREWSSDACGEECTGWSCSHCEGKLPHELPSCGRFKCEKCLSGEWRWQPGGC